ncbi:hypothetical protein HEQ63_07390 [Haematospirillum jordaniae]|uniref:divergent polysaccharide deacetylase family protein n=1 Tax=Haematospirillum jordaniae TaxID=1549855 RepID=UPI00143283FC|nr:divergent polysaccharide deacetylase family protein [Haematospirillum jordaniae]NKD86003.1 hypothetical protein [Haematospirillum jordaniae]
MAFSLKSLFGGKKESADNSGEDELPFRPEPEEIPESEVRRIEEEKKPKPGLLDTILGKGKKKKKGKKSSKGDDANAVGEGTDPLDNPALLALIASEVADLPPPETAGDDGAATEPGAAAGPGPSPADAIMPDDEAAGIDDVAGIEDEVGSPDLDDFDLPPALSGPDRAEQDWRNRQRKQALIGSVLAILLLGGGGAALWWFMQPKPLPPEVDPGLVVINEKGEAVAVPAPEPMASGDKISLMMPPPPPANPEPLPEPKLAEGASDPSAERSKNRRPWLAGDGTQPLPTDQTAPPPPAQTTEAGKTESAEKPAEPTPPPPNETATTPAVETAQPPPTAPKAPEPAKTTVIAGLPPFRDPVLPEPRKPGQAMPSYATIPVNKGDPKGLDPAPDPSLIKTSRFGPLPMISSEGKMPWKVYRRPAPDTKGPKIGVVIGGLGLHPEATETAITKLPPDITLSFSPYAPQLENLVQRARSYGHEVMLDLPMEEQTFPSADPGPLGLLTALPPSENLTRLEMVMGKAGGYVGLLGRPGHFTGSGLPMQAVLDALGKSGILYIQAGMPPATDSPDKKGNLSGYRKDTGPVAVSDLTIEARSWRSSVDARLEYAAHMAKTRGTALVVLFPSPLTFERLMTWNKGLATNGTRLVPATAVVNTSAS